MDTQQVKVLSTGSDSYDYVGCTTLAALADVRGEIKDVEAGIKERISVSDTQRMTETLNLHNRLCESEKAAIEAKFEGRLETKDAIEKINNKIEHCCEEQTEALTAFKDFVAEKFCDLEKRELEEEISSLKQAQVNATNDGILTTLNAILAKLK